MKDNDLVKLWGGNINHVFDMFASDDWQADRWKRQWGKHRLLPSKIRQIIREECSDETNQDGRKEIPKGTAPDSV